MAVQENKSSLLWLDLEMTGLNPNKDLILEVALIITDFSFNEITTFQTRIKQNPLKVKKLLEENPFYASFPENKKSFLDEKQDYPDDSKAEEMILKLIDDFCANQVVYLAGNSIYNDRKFISKYMPSLDSRLHYRMLDVSSFKILMQEKFKKEYVKKNQHRAMSDVIESINELKYYMQFLDKKILND